jgi:hypothetical protein
MIQRGGIITRIIYHMARRRFFFFGPSSCQLPLRRLHITFHTTPSVLLVLLFTLRQSYGTTTKNTTRADGGYYRRR